MAELRQMAFDVTCREIGVTEMRAPGHVAVVSHALPDVVSVRCSCHETSRWKIARAKATSEEIKATFNSHLSFFDRPKMTTL